METVTNTPGLAAEVERLRELVLDQGQAIAALTAEHGAVKARLRTLEADTPAARQAQYEADLAAAGLAESGYGEPW